MKPHQANMVQAFMAVTNRVNRSRFFPNISEKPARTLGAAALPAFQISGSRTLFWIQSVKKAGMTPTKKTPLQPHTGLERNAVFAQEIDLRQTDLHRVEAEHVVDRAVELRHFPGEHVAPAGCLKTFG